MERQESAAISGNSVEFSTSRPGCSGENVVFVMRGIYSQRGRPYNPLIAEERGAKRRRAQKQVAENERDFET